VKFSGDRSEHDFIPRLWATRRVGYLLDEIRLRGESKELKDEVSDLARKYNIVTPYTAYLIIEDETRRQVPTAMQSFRFNDNVTARNELQADYYSLVRDKDGDRGVAGARSARDLKAAQSAGDAITLGLEEGFRGRMASSAPVAGSSPTSRLNLPSSRDSGAGVAGGYPYATSGQSELRKKSSELAGQSRFVKGRTFYRNGSQWVDALAQTAPEATRSRIRFNSPEYFELLKQHPEASGWLSLGRNLQLVLGRTVYEIYDSE